MDEVSARHALPYILPGQAQKELSHNEALAAIDILLHPAVEGAPASTPPGEPDPGQCWLVGPDATGAWAGRTGSLAAWTSGGWRFASPHPAMSVWDKTAGLYRRWTGSGWSGGEVVASALSIGGVHVVGTRQPGIAAPLGGAVIDEQARAALAAVIVSLRTHGLIE